MGFFTQRVERSDLEAGDHIYTWRTPVFAYSHHGIYVGDDKVVHFTQHHNSNSGGSTSFCSSSSVPKIAATCSDFADCGLKEHKSGVVKSCLNCFLGDGSLYRFQYGVSGLALVTKLRGGTCTIAKSDPPEDVIHRAMYLLEKGYGKYDVLSNNCEDFALYCKTGLVYFGQDGRDQGSCSGQSGSFAGVPVSLLLSLGSKIFSSNPYVFGATTVGTYAVGRYANDVGVTENVRKVAVEELAALRDNLPAKEDVCGDGADISKDCPKEGSLRPKFCGHNMKAELLTSDTDANPYRRYYCCQWREVDDCGLFEWIDPEPTQFQKKCVQTLKAERDRLDGSLKLQNLELKATQKLNMEAQGMVEELVADKVELNVMVLKVMREKKSVSRKLGVSTIVNLILIPMVVALYCGCLTSVTKIV